MSPEHLLWPFVTGLIGVVIGAGLQHWFQAARERTAYERGIQSEQISRIRVAYVEFFDNYLGVLETLNKIAAARESGTSLAHPEQAATEAASLGRTLRTARIRLRLEDPTAAKPLDDLTAAAARIHGRDLQAELKQLRTAVDSAIEAARDYLSKRAL